MQTEEITVRSDQKHIGRIMEWLATYALSYEVLPGQELQTMIIRYKHAGQKIDVLSLVTKD